MTNRAADEKSLGAIFRELTEDLSTLVRSEVALAKMEIRRTAANVGLVGALFALALFLAILAIGFLVVTVVLALALVIPAWLAALIIAVALLIAAAVLVMVGKSKLETIDFAPHETVESVKSNVEAIRTDLERLKRDF